MCLGWGTRRTLQRSEKAADYFYPALKAGAAVSKVNNYSDCVAALLQSQTQTKQTHFLQCIMQPRRTTHENNGSNKQCH